MHRGAQAPEYCHGIDEESILKHQFELIFALDEVISLGYRENVNMVRRATMARVRAPSAAAGTSARALRAARSALRARRAPRRVQRRVPRRPVAREGARGPARRRPRRATVGAAPRLAARRLAARRGLRLVRFARCVAGWQVHIRAYTEMESHEEKLANMIKASKVNEAKEEMKRKVSQIDKDKAERRKAGGGDSTGSSMMEGFGKMLDDSSAQLQQSAPLGGTTYRPPEDYAKSAAAAMPARSIKAGGGMQLGKKSTKVDLMAAMASEGAIAPTPAPSARPAAAGGASGIAAAVVASGALQLNVEEKVVAVLGRDGGVQSLEVKGDLQLLVSNPAVGKLTVGVSFGNNAGFQFKTHPNINKALFAEQSILGLKDASRSFPPGNALGVLKWRLQTADASMVPLTGARRARRRRCAPPPRRAPTCAAPRAPPPSRAAQ